MPAIRRLSDSPYRWDIIAAPLAEVANQEKATYQEQQRAETARIETENARGTANMQAQLAGAQVSVEINKSQAEARRAEAEGEAAYIQLTGQADRGGTVQLSAYGDGDPMVCALDGIEPRGANLIAGVSCFGRSGAEADTRFELAWTRPRPGATGRYAYAAGGADPDGTPIAVPKRYAFNSTGKGTSVVRTDPGRKRPLSVWEWSA